MKGTAPFWTEARRCRAGWELECSWCGVIGTTATDHSADWLLIQHTRMHEDRLAKAAS